MLYEDLVERVLACNHHRPSEAITRLERLVDELTSSGPQNETGQPTPGPWEVGDIRAVREQREVLARDRTVLVALCGGSEAPRDANARLIAAAPDLLKACHTMLEGYNLIPVPDSEHEAEEYRGLEACRRNLIRAIEKATG